MKRIMIGALIGLTGVLALTGSAQANAGHLRLLEARRALHAYVSKGERVSHITCDRLGPRKVRCDTDLEMDAWAIHGEDREAIVVHGPANFHIRCRKDRAEVFDFAFEKWSRPLTRC